jgi:HPr kinase/phosphorylase
MSDTSRTGRASKKRALAPASPKGRRAGLRVLSDARANSAAEAAPPAARALKKTINIHATLVRVGKAGRIFGAPADAGVLLLGPSGAGKSDLALRLIALGAKLVADDRTELFVSRGRLYGRPPPTIAGMIEARGIGIMPLPHALKARIALAVELKAGSRMPAPQRWRPPAALALAAKAAPPLVNIASFEASAAVKILLAAAVTTDSLRGTRANTI